MQRRPIIIYLDSNEKCEKNCDIYNTPESLNTDYVCDDVKEILLNFLGILVLWFYFFKVLITQRYLLFTDAIMKVLGLL